MSSFALRVLIGLLGIGALSTSAAEAQIRSWSNSVSGLWTDATKWADANVADSDNETAEFYLFGDYAVSIPGGQPTLSIAELTVGRSEVTLRTDGTADAALRVIGDTTVDSLADLRFDSLAGTALDFTVNGSMRIAPSSTWRVEGGNVTTGGLSIASSTHASGSTTVDLLDGVNASLGHVTVGELASGNFSALSLFDGTTASVDSLRIGTDDRDLIAEVNVQGSMLTQSPATTTTIGAAFSESTGRASLVATAGGSVELHSVDVLATGQLLNVGGTVAIADSLQVAGGQYTERSSATRDFTALNTLQIEQSGSVTLVGAPLTLASGQTVSIDDATFSSEGGLVIAGGDLTLGATGPVTISGPTTVGAGGSISVAPAASVEFAGDYTGPGMEGDVVISGNFHPAIGIGEATFAGDLTLAELTIEIGPSDHDRLIVGGEARVGDTLNIELTGTPNLGDEFLLINAAQLTGSFATIHAPVLGAELDWRLEQTADSLKLIVVEPTIPGDYNHDGLVNAADYTVYRDSSGLQGAAHLADGNHDQQVDSLDESLWKAAYGSSNAVPSIVPEPAAAIQALLALGWLLRQPARPSMVA